MRYLRQQDYIPTDQAKRLPITVIGAGGIGSWTILALSKTGFKNIKAYDHDVVEEHNLSNQSFGDRHKNKHKVDSINDVLSYFGEGQIEVAREKFERGKEARRVVIVGVDSLEARREIFNAIEYDANVDLLIDGRMGLTTMMLYCVDMTDRGAVSAYKESLEGETANLPCTARTTMSTAMTIGSMITTRVVNYVNGQKNDFCTIMDTKTNDHIRMEG